MTDVQAAAELADPPRDASPHAGPIQRVKLPNGVPAWLVTRHAEVREVLNDARLSNRDQEDWFDQGVLSPQVRAAMNTHMMRIDPPDHTRMRKLVARPFTRRRIEALRPRIQQLVSDLLDQLEAAGKTAELIEEYAGPLPVRVICELLGVPAEDRDKYRHWSDAFTDGVGAPVFPAQEVTDFVEHIRELVARRRAEPDDGLLSALIATHDETGALNEDELISTAFLFIVAGHETTTNLISNGIYLLLSAPERADRIRAHPDELEQAIEEILRYESPVTGAVPRTATCALNLFGADIAAGDIVLVSIAAANRDDSVFSCPSEFRMDRDRSPHLSFGHGIHHCLGAPLARMEGQIAIGEFLNRFPQARLAAPGSLQWRPALLTRGLNSLPVVLG